MGQALFLAFYIYYLTLCSQCPCEIGIIPTGQIRKISAERAEAPCASERGWLVQPGLGLWNQALTMTHTASHWHCAFHLECL